MDFSQIELPVFVLAVVANLALAVIVFQYAQKSLSRYLFPIFVLLQIAWIGANYSTFLPSSDIGFLWRLRIVFVFATLHTYGFYFFIRTFLIYQEKVKFAFIKVLGTFGLLVAGFVTSPFVLGGVEVNALGQKVPQVLPGIVVFSSYIAFCIAGGFYTIVKRYKSSEGVVKKQWQFLAIGLISTFILVFVLSFLSFIVFGNVSTVRFGHVYTLPFVFFTAYAMVRHKLLDIKAVVAELAVILLVFILIIQVVNASTFGQRMVSIFVLLGTLVVGWLLIKGVYREIAQRQKLQDLTGELELANSKLKDLDKARADFITIASHQLRTPPATIKWYVAAILSGDFGELLPDVKAQLTKVQATNNSQISLIDDMLNASRIERGKMEFLFEEIEVEPMAKITYDQLTPLAEMKGLKLVYNPPKQPLPKVMADIEKLRQVMNNFIDNAIKYTEKGTVTAELFQDGDNIRFQVTDSGMGIRPDLAPHLFNKYSRGQDSVTHAQGLGLGLYVCKMVVDQHHGKIWAESPGEGKGSTFIFTIPIHNNLKATTLVDLAGGMDIK